MYKVSRSGKGENFMVKTCAKKKTANMTCLVPRRLKCVGKKAEKAERGRRVARAMEYGKVQHWHKGPSHAPLRSVNLVLDHQILHLDMESK